MWKITRAGLRTQQKNINDDDDGTVIDRKLIIFNNITTNSRFNHSATDADATAAFAVIFPLAVVVLRAFMIQYRHPNQPKNIRRTMKTGETWSIFNVFN